MNKKILILLVSLLLSTSYAQKTYISLGNKNTKNHCPIFLINDTILSNGKGIEKESIIDASVLKVKSSEQAYYNLTENGMVFLRLHAKITSKTQAELNTFMGLKEDNALYVNGYLVENKAYSIATDSIFSIELIVPNAENELEQNVINIWLWTKEEREKGCKG